MRVAIIGFGVEGKDAVSYFLKKGAKITVFDNKEETDLQVGEWKLKGPTFKCGPSYLKDGLVGFDLIVRSPGFYRYHPALLEAEKKGIRISSNSQIFFEECKKPIVAITGTKGKGTTARMLDLGLREHGFKTTIGGNMGEAILALLTQANKSDWVILELSSFQTIDLTLSPKIVVCTNISTDHMDWHKDREEYVRAKENLWQHQANEDIVVLNADDPTTLKLSKNVHSRVFLFSTKGEVQNGSYLHSGEIMFAKNGQGIKIGKAEDLQVVGEHNWSNALAALTAAVLASANLEEVWKGITKYSGYENRLEDLGEIKGVCYINDSASTHPESTIAAIKAYDTPKILILGGSSKGVQFNELAEEITKTNVKAVLLIGQTSDDLESTLKTANFAGTLQKGFANMKSVVKRAAEIAKSGDVVLLSPACASFGMFKDYKDRGEQFKKEVEGLK